MDLNLWKGISDFVAIDKYPTLPCPHCNKHSLILDRDSVQTRVAPEKVLLDANRKYRGEKQKQQQSSQKNLETIRKSNGTWLPIIATVFSAYQDSVAAINGTPFLFSGFFKCNECEHHVSATGILLKPVKGFSDVEKIPHIKVDNFSPTVPVFPLSGNTPKVIGEELFDAFKHFHFDPPSSASKLRRAIEKFCDDMQVEGSNLNRKVQNLAKTHPEEAAYLEPLKLVGNEGTHGSNVEELDLLYAFQMFQFVLELYDRKARFESLQETYDKLANKVGRERLQLTHKKEQAVEAIETE
ncbi:DUF4145 domain-containing protein [Pseudoalteromonas piscicida]|uniref:DUF4145 domain-containing protein n=1 Tax=Pseudoalteromonas piscicida TaxID=43662 RepID=UPI001EFE341C|nr:DUF4145 domain-containing protein [Pseudoalteromonas piscicida]MCG9769315.1 DUF4145 domain-containing protein [Pseudoalteromonas piscicida]